MGPDSAPVYNVSAVQNSTSSLEADLAMTNQILEQ